MTAPLAHRPWTQRRWTQVQVRTQGAWAHGRHRPMGKWALRGKIWKHITSQKDPKVVEKLSNRRPMGPCPTMATSALNQWPNRFRQYITVPRGCAISSSSWGTPSGRGTTDGPKPRKYSAMAFDEVGNARTRSPSLHPSVHDLSRMPMLSCRDIPTGAGYVPFPMNNR